MNVVIEDIYPFCWINIWINHNAQNPNAFSERWYTWRIWPLPWIQLVSFLATYAWSGCQYYIVGTHLCIVQRSISLMAFHSSLNACRYSNRSDCITDRGTAAYPYTSNVKHVHSPIMSLKCRWEQMKFPIKTNRIRIPSESMTSPRKVAKYISVCDIHNQLWNAIRGCVAD